MEAEPVWVALGRNAVIYAQRVCVGQPEYVTLWVHICQPFGVCVGQPKFFPERVTLDQPEFDAQFNAIVIPKFIPKFIPK